MVAVVAPPLQRTARLRSAPRGPRGGGTYPPSGAEWYCSFRAAPRSAAAANHDVTQSSPPAGSGTADEPRDRLGSRGRRGGRFAPVRRRGIFEPCDRGGHGERVRLRRQPGRYALRGLRYRLHRPHRRVAAAGRFRRPDRRAGVRRRRGVVRRQLLDRRRNLCPRRGGGRRSVRGSVRRTDPGAGLQPGPVAADRGLRRLPVHRQPHAPVFGTIVYTPVAGVRAVFG